MNNTLNTVPLKASLCAVLITSAYVVPMPVAASEGIVSINVGFLSDYIFRGIDQDSSVANGGVDINYEGLYAGVWVADVGEGVEYDLYAGYQYEFDNGLYLGTGYTSYQYSDNFDAEYNEVNLYSGGAVGDVTLDLEYSIGKYNDDFVDKNGSVDGDDYNFIAATFGYKGAYVTYGDFGDDASDALGNYVEAGYATEVFGFEIAGALVHSMDLNDGSGDDDDTKVYLSVSWGLDVL